MIAKQPLRLLPLALLGLLGATGNIRISANERGDDHTQNEVQDALRAVERAFQSEASPAALAALLYTSDVVIVGEGDAKATRGITAAVKDVQGWYDSLGPHGQRTCKYTLVMPIVQSESTFSAFYLLHCSPNPPIHPKDEQLRMIYAWRKEPQGWRVALEMWAPGLL